MTVTDKHHAASPVGGKQALNRYQRHRRLILGGLLLVLFALLLFVQSSLDEAGHESVEQIGTALIALGIAGRLWATLYVGGRKAAEIVRTGPYSVMRNPLYFFSTIAAAGAGAMMGSVSVAVLFAVLCAVAFHIVILREEKFLRETFGAPYEAYLAKVPRFFPDPRLYCDQQTVSFRPDRLWRTLIDGLVFFAAFPVFELIEAGQNSGALPVILRLP